MVVHEYEVRVTLQFDSVTVGVSFPEKVREEAVVDAVCRAVRAFEADGFVHELADEASIGVVSVELIR
jgi:hypothetical protein